MRKRHILNKVTKVYKEERNLMRHVLVIDKVNVCFELKGQRRGLVDQSQLTKVFYNR